MDLPTVEVTKPDTSNMPLGNATYGAQNGFSISITSIDPKTLTNPATKVEFVGVDFSTYAVPMSPVSMPPRDLVFEFNVNAEKTSDSAKKSSNNSSSSGKPDAALSTQVNNTLNAAKAQVTDIANAAASGSLDGSIARGAISELNKTISNYNSQMQTIFSTPSKLSKTFTLNGIARNDQYLEAYMETRKLAQTLTTMSIKSTAVSLSDKKVFVHPMRHPSGAMTNELTNMFYDNNSLSSENINRLKEIIQSDRVQITLASQAADLV